MNTRQEVVSQVNSVMVESRMQKVGNSMALIIPKQIRTDASLDFGDKVLVVSNGHEVSFSRRTRNKTLDDILSECDMSAPHASDLWENTESVGSEML